MIRYVLKIDLLTFWVSLLFQESHLSRFHSRVSSDVENTENNATLSSHPWLYTDARHKYAVFVIEGQESLDIIVADVITCEEIGHIQM